MLLNKVYSNCYIVIASLELKMITFIIDTVDYKQLVSFDLIPVHV